MAFQKAALPLTFAGGVETKMDDKAVPTARLLDLQNATFTKRMTLAKRNGYEALGQQVDGAAATYTGARGLAERDDELVLFTEKTSLSYRPSSDSWSDVGDVASVTCTTMPVARSGTQQMGPDAATNLGTTLVGWEDSRGGVWCTVLEEGTGRVLLAEVQLDASANAKDVRCCRCGQVNIILWRRADQNALWIAISNPAEPQTAPTPMVLTSDLLASNPTYDAMYRPDDDTATIAWAVSGGYRTGYIDQSGVLGSPVTGWASVATHTATFSGPIAIAAGDSDDWAVAYCAATLTIDFLDAGGGFAINRTAVTFMGSDPVTNGATRVTLAWGSTASGSVWYALERNVVDRWDEKQVVSGRIIAGDSSLDNASAPRVLGHSLASRAFRDGYDGVDQASGDVYVAVCHPVQLFPYIAVVRLSAATGFGGVARTTAMARLLPSETAGYLSRGTPNVDYEPIAILPSITEVGFVADQGTQETRIHSFATGYRIALSSENNDQFAESGIKVCTLDFDNASSYQTAELGRGLYLGGACAQHYDGSRWGEADVHTAPDVGYDTDGVAVDMADELFTPSAVVSAGFGNGTYLYKLWYEYVDAQGELHVGPTRSVLVEVDVVFPDGFSAVNMTIAIPSYRLTQRDNVRLCVARSVAGQTGTEATIPLYRVTGTDPSITTGANCFVFNDPTSDTVSFTDALTDAELLEREPLYTNGGILSNDPSPWAGGVIAGGKSRLFWTDPTDPNLVRYSQELRDDTALEAPAVLSLQVDPYGGGIVGIGILDDAVVVLKDTAVYVFGGPGPDADGGFASQNAFSPAQLVTSDVGCSSPTSIAQTPVGIVFQSSKGIFLLGRDRSVKSIGDPVYAYKDQRISRATLLPDRHQVVFLTDEGRTLLWDYEVDQWSTYMNHEGYDASVVDGTYHYLRNDGRVFRETPGLYVDDNAHIPMVIETAWVKFSGYLQGWQRIIHAMVVGTYKSSHDLRIRWRIDYQAAYSAPIDIDVDADYDDTGYGDGGYGDGAYGGDVGYGVVYQQRVHINRRCQAISFRIEDIEPTDTYGAAFELSELLLTGAGIGPAFQPGAARSQ